MWFFLLYMQAIRAKFVATNLSGATLELGNFEQVRRPSSWTQKLADLMLGRALPDRSAAQAATRRPTSPMQFWRVPLFRPPASRVQSSPAVIGLMVRALLAPIGPFPRSCAFDKSSQRTLRLVGTAVILRKDQQAELCGNKTAQGVNPTTGVDTRESMMCPPK